MIAAAGQVSPDLSAAERRRLLLGAYVSMIGLAACTSPLAVCLTALSHSFPELTTAGLGFLSTVMLGGLVVGLLLAGPLADHWGLRPFLILGEALEALGLVAVGMAPTVPVLLAAVGLAGVGLGLIDGLTSPLVAELQPEQRTRALNWLHACYPLGFLAMGGVATVLLRASGSWRLVFPAVSLPALVGMAIFLLSRFPRSPVQGEGLAALRAALPGPFLWIGAVGIFLAGATELGISQWTPAYVERGLRHSREAGAVVVLALAALMLVGRLSAGALAHRVRPARLMLAASGACLGAILVAALAPAGPAMVALPLLGLAVACIWPTALAYTADRLPRAGATVYSLLGAAGNAGGALAPGFIGLVAQGHGLRQGIAAAALFPLAAALLMTWRAVVEKGEGAG